MNRRAEFSGFATDITAQCARGRPRARLSPDRPIACHASNDTAAAGQSLLRCAKSDSSQHHSVVLPCAPVSSSARSTGAERLLRAGPAGHRRRPSILPRPSNSALPPPRRLPAKRDVGPAEPGLPHRFGRGDEGAGDQGLQPVSDQQVKLVLSIFCITLRVQGKASAQRSSPMAASFAMY